MDTFPKLSISIQQHKDRKPSYYFKFDGRVKPEPKMLPALEDRIPNVDYYEHDPTPFISSWWYMFMADDLESLKWRGGIYADCYNRVEACGDQWSFYYLDLPHRENPGYTRSGIRYWHCQFPRFAVKILARYLRGIATKMGDEDRTDVEIPLEVRERWLKRYGQGTGQVKIVMDERTQERFEKAPMQESLKEALESPLRLARGRTSKWTDVTEVRLFARDEYEFSWSAIDTKGQRFYNGGLILHGANDGGGNGSAPTFSVSLTPTTGWQCHT